MYYTSCPYSFLQLNYLNTWNCHHKTYKQTFVMDGNNKLRPGFSDRLKTCCIYSFIVLPSGTVEDGTLKSLRFQRDPGKQSKESIPKDHESGEGETTSTEVADKNNTCQVFKDNGKRDKRKVREQKEGALEE